MDHNTGSGSKRRNEVLKDLDAVFVGPVVKDPAEIVNVCHDWLFGEEIAK